MPLRTFMTRAREEVKIPTVIGVRKKWIWSLTDDCEGFKTSWEQGASGVVKTAKELEVEPVDVTKLLKSQDKTLTGEELLLTYEQRNGFLRWNWLLVIRLKTVEMATKDVEYDINLADKATVRSERTAILKEVLWVKCYWAAMHASEKMFMKGTLHWCCKPHCSLILRNCHTNPKLQQPPPWSESSSQHWEKILHQQKQKTCQRLRWWCFVLFCFLQ